MKKIKKILFVFATLFLGMSCTDYNVVKTGLADGNHKTTMWEYFKTDSYNWALLMEMAKHAELENIFNGTSSYGKDITFLGITSHSIRRYLYENSYEKVTDIPKEDCKRFILSSILDKRITLDEFVEGKPSADPSKLIGEGGKIYTTLSGRKLWIYTYKDVYEGVPGAGPKRIYIVSLETQLKSEVASSNIMTQTGVVHSLVYNFTINDF